MKNVDALVQIFAAVLTLAAVGAGYARADVRLPAVIDSHMVLQRGVPLPIWGWAAPGEAVSVQMDKLAAVATKADEKGKWKVTLPAMKADGKPHRLTVSGKNKIVLEDILIGEVWIGSGQSNMEWYLKDTKGAKVAIFSAHQREIRLFHVPAAGKDAPADDVQADWTACTSKTVPRFSAVLYFFGLRLHKELDVPVGLINSSSSGSRIEPWIVTAEGSGKLHNGMIAPLVPLAIRGFIWYQGEANEHDGLAYHAKMEKLIAGWRKAWASDFPFYFVQLAPFRSYKDGDLPAMWEAQAAALKTPGTGMAVITDLVDDITAAHPRQKRDVGDRLALWALAKTYGKSDLVYSGPLYKSMKIEGDKIRLTFAHTGDGLKSRDGKLLTEFEIAGADGKFVPAPAEIDGKTVLVGTVRVKSPTQVRFGWHKRANPNLTNSAGLPASPFRTNNWQGGTGE